MTVSFFLFLCAKQLFDIPVSLSAILDAANAINASACRKYHGGDNGRHLVTEKNFVITHRGL